MAVLAETIVALGADTAALRKGLSEGTAALRQFGRNAEASLKTMSQSLDAMMIPLRALPAVLGTVAGNSVVQFARRNLEAAGSLGELAEQIGISTDALQGLQYAASQSNVSAEQLEGGMSKFSKTIGEAAAGGNDAIESFKRLGVGILDSTGHLRSTESILADVANAIRAIPDPADRAKAAVDLFGKTGQKLLPILSQGSDGLRRFMDDARQGGQILSRDLIEQADKAADKIAAMERSFAALSQTLAAKAGPAMGYIADQMRKMAGGATVLEQIADAQKEVARLEAQPLAKERESSGRFADLTNARARLRALQQGNAEQARQRDLADSTSYGDTQSFLPQSKNDIEKEKQRAETVQKLIKNLNAEADAHLLVGQAAWVSAAQKGLNVSVTEQENQAITAGAIRKGEAELAEKGLQATIRESVAWGQKEDSARKASTESVNKQIMAKYGLTASLDEEIRNNNALIESLRVGQQAYEQTAMTQRILADARSKGAAITDQEAAEYAGILTAQRKKIDDVTEAQQTLKAAGQDMFHVIGSAAEDALVSFSSWRDVLAGVLQDIQRIILRLTVTKPLENAAAGFLGGVGGSGGFLSGIFGSGSTMTAAQSNAFYNPTGYADGTTNAAAGWHLVGENGPELANFGSGGGTVIPAGQTAAMMNGGDSIHVSINISAGVAQTVRAEIMNMMPAITHSVKNGVLDAKMRGGRYGSGFA